MLISLSRLDTSEPAEYPVFRYTSAMPMLRRYGQLEFLVPEDAPGFDERYISQDEPFRVLATGDGVGSFPGFALGARFAPEGAYVTAHHVAKQFDRWPVETSGPVFRSITAGAILRYCAFSAFSSRGETLLNLGSFVEAAPRIVRFEVRGQMFSEVVSQMMDYTGQEYEIDNDYQFNWVPHVGIWRPEVHADSGLLFTARFDVSFENQATAVSGRLPNGQSYTVRVS